jgi:LPXTG-motif cell wall-anchored protein
MMRSRGRFRLATFGLCATGALLGAVTLPATAGAAAAPGVELSVSNMVVTPDSPGKYQSVALINNGQDELLLNHVTVTVDTAGLAGVATVTSADSWAKCTTAGTVLTCELAEYHVDPIGVPETVLGFDVKPVAGVKLGAAGTFKATLAADGLAPMAKTAKVTIAEGVDLAAGADLAVSAAPGGKVALPYPVRNSGKTVAHGAVLTFTKPAVAEYGARYRNCQYTDWWVLCTFDGDLAVGKEYTLAKPQVFNVRADSPAPRSFNGFYQWATPADAEIEWLDEFRKLNPVRGDGGELRLVEQAPKIRANAQTDTNELDNAAGYTMDITGENVGDDAAVGSTVTGTVGSTVPVTIGLKNLGPARIGLFDGVADRVTVTVPKGTTVVTVPDACLPVVNGEPDGANPGKPGAAVYQCYTEETNVIEVGQTYTWQLGLRIDVAGETVGTVSVEPREHANRDNDTAKLIVNPAGGTGGGTGDGGLPVTGSNAVLLGSAGAAMILLGAFGYAVARRRRTRFVA